MAGPALPHLRVVALYHGEEVCRPLPAQLEAVRVEVGGPLAQLHVAVTPGVQLAEQLGNLLPPLRGQRGLFSKRGIA